jgi:hypothetical protein
VVPPPPPAPPPQPKPESPSLPAATLARQEPVAPPAPPAAPKRAPVESPPPAQPELQGDLSAYIEARRRARGESSPPAADDRPWEGSPAGNPRQEDDIARRDRVVAQNLGLDRGPTVGYDPKGGGGIFEMQYVARDSAAFLYFGWHRDIKRNARQLIEVERGNNTDIRIAVVRRMIALIRSEVIGDFMWVSQRHGNVALSSRPEDNAELEQFLMREFFGDPRR